MKDEEQAFLESLSKEERLLIHVRDVIYDGHWGEIEADLNARLEGKPYIIKLAGRIEDDLKRIEKLRSFEREHGADVGRLLRQYEDEKDTEGRKVPE